MSIRQIPLSAASLSRAEDASAPPTRAGFAAFCLFASWTTETYSHVDRLWSITPAVYACMYALLSGWDPRCTLMALLTVMWGWRLTFNFARKGGYNEGEQDYRWPILRAHPLLRHPLVWQVFNFGFIASYQNLLLLLISSPSSAAYRARGAPLNALDAVAAAAMCFFIAIEAVADQQQWDFQQSKRNVTGFPRPRGDAMITAAGFSLAVCSDTRAIPTFRGTVRVDLVLRLLGGGRVGGRRARGLAWVV